MKKRKKKIKRWKKRFIFLNVLIIALILGSLWYIESVGDDYDVPTGVFVEQDALKDVQMACSKDDRVIMTDYYFSKKGEVMVSLESDEHGQTDATFTFKLSTQNDPIELKTHFTVNEMDTIIEDRDGVINFNGYLPVFYAFLGLMAVILIISIGSFIGCLKKSDFSYSMIGYGGVSLYLIGMLAFLIYKALNNAFSTFSNLVFELSQVGLYFSLVMVPFMLIMAIAVSISNIWLMGHEGFRPVNALGILFSALWIAGMVIGFVLNNQTYATVEEFNLFHQIQSVLIYVIIYFECMLISTSLSAILASRHTPPYDRDYIIILGCCVRKDGSLTPLLKGRVDSALSFEKRQYRENGRHACFIPAGGQGPNEPISEGEAMERYLIEQGVPAERILREDKSVNTNENMKFAKEIIEKANPEYEKINIAFATTSYHVFRGYVLAMKNGFKAQGISSKTKWYFFPNAFLREFLGLLRDRLVNHIVFLILIALAVIGIEYIM